MEQIPDGLRRILKQNAAKIEQSEVFLCLFNPSMLDEVLPILQMGCAVYFDKPILIAVPEKNVLEIPKNLRAMAERIEVYEEHNEESLRQAISSLVEHIKDR